MGTKNGAEQSESKSVLSISEKRKIARKLLERREAGEVLGPEEQMVLLVFMHSAGTPSMKSRYQKFMDQAVAAAEALKAARQARLAAAEPEVDLYAVGRKLDELGYMLLALYESANTAPEGGDMLRTIAQQFAKRGVHIIDAIHGKLGQIKLGNWNNEFEEVEQQPAEEVSHG
jgi:hypothetical protein